MPASAPSFGPIVADRGEDVTDDAVLGGRLRLIQKRRGHRVGHDAILLAAATAASSGDHVVDLGAGIGAAGLAVAARVAGASVTLVEIDPELAALAGENAQRNGLADRVRTTVLDVAAPADAFVTAGLPPDSAAHVLMNPPFNDPTRTNLSPDAGRRRAHVTDQTLAVWVGAARRLLRPRGVLTLIWRADGLAEVLAASAGGFGAVAILPVHPRPDAAAIRILVGATKGSAAGLTVLPGLMLNDAAGRPTARVEAILREGERLTLSADDG